MVLFRQSESAHSMLGTEGVTDGEDSPRLLRMSPLRHNIVPNLDSPACDTEVKGNIFYVSIAFN